MIFDIMMFLIINLIGLKIIGKWFLVVEIILMFIFFIWLWFKKYRPVYDKVNLFTGAPGTGKSKLMIDVAIHKYRVERRQAKINNFFINIINKFRKNKKDLKESPNLYSNIPIRLSKKEYSNVLTEDILLLQKRIPKKSVVVIDELSELVNNQDYKNLYAKKNIDEFVRFYRQYTHGGWLFMADQSSDNVLVQIRRRVGKVYNMMSFRKIPLLNIGLVNIRHLSISEDIKVIEQGNAENLKENTSWIPLFFYKKYYDTYAFSGRVKDMTVEQSKQYIKMKTNILLDIPFIDKPNDNYKATKTKKED